jgi:formate hydrogenlyase subunit 6/NADH:ubiquinone oxidoreductase subunit I
MKMPGSMSVDVVRAVFQKSATTTYPAVKADIDEKLRGQILFIAPNCVGCKACMRDCPTGCIVISKVGEKRFQADFDLDRCIYCSQCVDSCPKDALRTSQHFELAQLEHSNLKAVFYADPAPVGQAVPSAGGPEKTPE